MTLQEEQVVMEGNYLISSEIPYSTATCWMIIVSYNANPLSSWEQHPHAIVTELHCNSPAEEEAGCRWLLLLLLAR